MKHLEVVAALIEKEGRFLVCQRPSHKAQGDLWEFAGGKIESGETPRQALVRECKEELEVDVAVGELFMEQTHTYSDRIVHLMVFWATIQQGNPVAKEHQNICWATPQQMQQLDFCPADLPMLEELNHIYKAK